MAVGPARPAIRGREQARRRHQSVDGSRRPRRARWLYAVGDRDPERDERSPARQSHVQHPARYRAGRLFRRHALCHGGDAVVPGANGSRIHRLRQGQSGQGQHGLEWHRQSHPCRRRVFQDDGRRRSLSRAVSRRDGGAGRSAIGPRPRHVRSDHRLARRHQGRQAARARRDDAGARRVAPRYTDRERICAGL